MINLVIVTHECIGQAYASLVQHVFGLIPENIKFVEVGNHENIDDIMNKLKQALPQSDINNGTLILTDIFGATPCNIAHKFIDHNRMILTGLNASMMIKAIQNAPLRNDVHILADEAKSSAIAGIMSISHQNTGNPI